MITAERVNNAPTPGLMVTVLVIAVGEITDTVTTYVTVTNGVDPGAPCHVNIGAAD